MNTRSGTCINRYQTFIPAILPPNPSLEIDWDTQNLIQSTERKIELLDTLLLVMPQSHLIIAMFARLEAVANLDLEGYPASLRDVFIRMAGIPQNNEIGVERVINSIAALRYGIEKLKTAPFQTELLREMHGIVYRGFDTRLNVAGEFRRLDTWIMDQNWPKSYNSEFAPPPQDMIQGLMNDINTWISQPSNLHPLVECGLLLYQLETIYPFSEGSGLISRLSISPFLFWKKMLKFPVLVITPFLMRNEELYLARLAAVRNVGDFETWLHFFLSMLSEAVGHMIRLLQQIQMLETEYENTLFQNKIGSPYAIQMLRMLMEKPVITAVDLIQAFDIPEEQALRLMRLFAQSGVGDLGTLNGNTILQLTRLIVLLNKFGQSE